MTFLHTPKGLLQIHFCTRQRDYCNIEGTCFMHVRTFTTLPLRGEDRMRLGNENKNLLFLFCISLGFHYLCENIVC